VVVAAQGDELMLLHPKLDRLRAYGANDLDGDERDRTAGHVAGCDRCRSTLAWMDDVRAAASAPAPEPSPELWQKIAARVAADEPVLLPVDHKAPPPRLAGESRFAAGGRALRVAGLALLVTGAAAAAVIPGSPVRAFLEEMIGAGQPAAQDSSVPPAAPPTPPVTLLIEPAAGAVVISLERPDATVRIHVRLVDGAELEVQALDGAAGATFRAAPGRLDIVAADAGAVILGVPRSLLHARIDVNGTAVLIKERGEVRILAPTADTVGSEYILPVRGMRDVRDVRDVRGSGPTD
jgi:hypothetical protein